MLLFVLSFFLSFFFGTHEARGHMVSFFSPLSRQKISQSRIERQPFRLVLGSSPLSSGSLG